jgi:hypothetical protein
VPTADILLRIPHSYNIGCLSQLLPRTYTLIICAANAPSLRKAPPSWLRSVLFELFTLFLSRHPLGAPHARLLGYKLLFVGVMLVVSFVHDFMVGPRAGRAEKGTASARRLRSAAAALGAATGGLVLAIVVLAVLVARPGMV